ncbi:MAG TPA: phenylalanine--tRNA ligase subunit alpha [Chloroflexota bacterium]|nr:phenylalanine--tRNA ligase subunit alpha [Chloroflexota bacterium]
MADVDVHELVEQIERIRAEAERALAAAETLQDVETVRVRFLGRKGELTAALSAMASLSSSDKPIAGNAANTAKRAIEESLEVRFQELSAEALTRQLKAERIDLTLPGRPVERGYSHPLLVALQEIVDIFIRMGYEVVEGREVEYEEYNFTKLNIPTEHPARDMWDTLYLSANMLLRTHTSPAQARVMETTRPPVRVIVPGRCYRNEAEDATHGIQFLQIEGLVVDTDITLADLKGTLYAFCRAYFGPDRELRFRPSYFPFTEPSAEVDVACAVCKGHGCRTCGFKGWLELLGAGMVHPNVLRAVGYDPQVYSGFAFGAGPDRLCIQKYGITDLRLFRENDLRFLEQFS